MLLVCVRRSGIRALAERGSGAPQFGSCPQTAELCPCLSHVCTKPCCVRCCSVDDGTLTRTMKPRRPAIMAKYAKQVAALEKHLR